MLPIVSPAIATPRTSPRVVEELKAAGPAVTVALDPPRTEVAVADHDPSRGPANAPITIIEFSEY